MADVDKIVKDIEEEAQEKIDQAKKTTSDAYEEAKEKTVDAYDKAKERVEEDKEDEDKIAYI